MNAPSEFQQALALYRAGNLAAAIALLRTLADRGPQDAQVLFYLGTAELQRGNAADAAGLLEQSLRLAANSSSYNNLGLALLKSGETERALDAFERAIRLKPAYADAHYNRGAALQALGRLGEALASYDRAIQLTPDHANTHNNRGVVLKGLKRPDEALASYEQAIRLKPDSAEAHNNRGNVLSDLKRPAEALASFAQALRLNPDYAEAHNNLGGALSDLDRPNEALQSYERAIRLKPDYAEAYGNRAKVLSDLGRLDEALLDFGRAMELKPEHGSWTGEWLHTKLSICDWTDFSAATERITSAIDAGRKVASPFLSLLVSGSAPLQRRAAEIWVHDEYPGQRSSPGPTACARRSRLRLAYFSADFRSHPVMHLVAEMLERHDRSRFELLGFSFGPAADDEWRRRARNCFEGFFDVRDRPDRAAAELARSLEIDIAVDLNGFTAYSRPGIFAERCAPIQVGYLGYPGTSGAPFIDYIVADETVIPEEARKHYTEQVAYLPDCYLPGRRDVEAAAELRSRTDCGLPEEGFVFCCFNGVGKIAPPVFDRWMRILRRVEGAVLWLAEGNRWAAANLRAEAQRRGVNPDRLVFAPRLPRMEEHLGRIRHADLFLDTLPYNAHTTASDALRTGVPLLTQIGTAFAGRVAASLLKTLDLGELITQSAAEYEELAVALATTPERLSAIRRKLTDRIESTPLYEPALLAGQIERIYEKMHERYLLGLPPAHIPAEGFSEGPARCARQP